MLPEGLLKEWGLPFVHGICCIKRVLDFCTLGSRCTAPWWSRGDLWLLSRAAREERAEPSDTGEEMAPVQESSRLQAWLKVPLVLPFPSCSVLRCCFLGASDLRAVGTGAGSDVCCCALGG